MTKIKECLILFFILPLLFLLGCNKQIMMDIEGRDSPTVHIWELIWKLNDSYEDKDINAFMQSISSEYKGGYNNLEMRIKQDFDKFEKININLDINIGASESKEKRTYVLENIRWRRMHKNTKTQKRGGGRGKTTFIVRREIKDDIIKYFLIDMQGDPLFGISEP